MHTGPGEPTQDAFQPIAGVSQGCILSPTLVIFLLFDYALRVAMRGVTTWPERTNWPALGGSLLALLGYADDLALTARNMATLQQRMSKLEDTCTRTGLSLSVKTKLLHLNPSSMSQPRGLQPKNFAAETVSTVVRLYRLYLGDEVNNSSDLQGTMRARLTKAHAVFALLRQIWSFHRLPTWLNTVMLVAQRPGPCRKAWSGSWILRI